MAGRYQGHHRLWDGNSEHIFEVMWQTNGWFWQTSVILAKRAMGPFTTSTEAYKNACERITAETKPLETR